jgi:DNA-binding LacI/PurR family transcriptional regulator
MQERMTGEKIASERTIFDVELIERDSVRKLNGARQREG